MKLILIVLLLTTFCFCTKTNKQINNELLPEPVIKAGTARISGSISNPESLKEKVTITVFVNNPVTAEETRFETNQDENDRFLLEVPLESSSAICAFGVKNESNYLFSGYIGLEQDKELQIKLVVNDKDGKKIDVSGGLNLASDDVMNILPAYARFEEHPTWGDYYKMTPGEFAEHELTISLKERINFALDPLPLSDKIRKHLVNDFKLRYLKARLFFYKQDAEKSYKMSEEENVFYTTYTAEEPGKSYYNFLRQFNLNNPNYLYCKSYSEFMQKFLTIAPFKIPVIKDTPVDEWLIGVKAAVQDAVGFNSGLFYDMLAANAYAHQLNDQKEPLTIKQVENIRDYYKNRNEEFSRILLKKNEEVKKVIQLSNDLRVNETPAAAKEKIIDNIIAKYKGSVVLVDLWATWCMPCMNAMAEIKPLKEELKKKGVVFAYITDGSSPKTLWEGKIKGIGGEHYYLAENEWKYVMENFSFTGIPSYLIYDRNGILKHKFTGYRGNEKIKTMIEQVLR